MPSLRQNAISVQASFLWVSPSLVEYPLIRAISCAFPCQILGFRELDQTHARFTVEEFADLAVQSIKARQPHGPYFLGAWCSSSILALEIARQLTQSGERVGLLALFDPSTPPASTNYADVPHHWLKLRRLMRRFLRICQQIRERPGNRVGYVRQKLVNAGQELTFNLRLTAHEFALKRPFSFNHPSRNYNIVYRSAVRRYKSKNYSGRIVIFRPETRMAQTFEANERWKQLANGGVEFVVTSGDHVTMFREENAEQLSELLTERVRTATEVEDRIGETRHREHAIARIRSVCAILPIDLTLPHWSRSYISAIRSQTSKDALHSD